MWTVFLQPFANVLLRPQHDGPDQAGLCGAGVIYPIVVAGTVLHPSKRGEEVKRKHNQTINETVRVGLNSRVMQQHRHKGNVILKLLLISEVHRLDSVWLLNVWICSNLFILSENQYFRFRYTFS